MSLLKNSVSLFALITGASLMATSASAQTPPRGLGDIVKHANGRVHFMTQHEASEYCSDHDSRLPTVRELALYATSLGAVGIEDTVYSGVADSDPRVQAEINRMRALHYTEILTLNDAGESSVDFYYNSEGYPRTSRAARPLYIWSSSSHPDQVRNPGIEFTYYLVTRAAPGWPRAGGIYFFDSSSIDHHYAVRCVR